MSSGFAKRVAPLRAFIGFSLCAFVVEPAVVDTEVRSEPAVVRGGGLHLGLVARPSRGFASGFSAAFLDFGVELRTGPADVTAVVAIDIGPRTGNARVGGDVGLGLLLTGRVFLLRLADETAQFGPGV